MFVPFRKKKVDDIPDIRDIIGIVQETEGQEPDSQEPESQSTETPPLFPFPKKVTFPVKFTPMEPESNTVEDPDSEVQIEHADPESERADPPKVENRKEVNLKLLYPISRTAHEKEMSPVQLSFTRGEVIDKFLIGYIYTC